LASSATTDWQIVLTQCLLFGVGGIMLNFVHVSIFSEWFDKQKVQAMSFIWQGWRLGSLGFPLICQWLLGTLGYEATLQWLLAFMVPLLLPAILVFRGRYP
jgi:MFS family permease